MKAEITVEAGRLAAGTSREKLEKKRIRKLNNPPKPVRPKYSEEIAAARKALKKMERDIKLVKDPEAWQKISGTISYARRDLSKNKKNMRIKEKKDTMNRLGEMSRSDPKGFFDAIKKHKADASSALPDRLITPDGVFEGDAVLGGFATEVARLGTENPDDENFDCDFLMVAKYMRIILLENARAANQKMPRLTIENAKRLMKKLKRNKAADVMDFTFEHMLNMSDTNLADALETLNRFIEDIKQLSSYVTNMCQAVMILKGSDRAKELVNSWRRISILPGFIHLLELYLSERLNEITEQTDEQEQFGYTPNLPFSHAKLMVNKAFAIARDQDRTCITLTIDAEACFPNVSRDIAICQLQEIGYDEDLLLYTNAILSNTLGVMKDWCWKTKPFREDKSYRQGGVRSANDAKPNLAGLIRVCKESQLGFQMTTNHKLPALLEADDALLLAGCPGSMQGLANLAHNKFSYENRVKYGASKTKAAAVTRLYDLKVLKDMKPITMDGLEVEITDSFKYLGQQICDPTLNAEDVNVSLRIQKTWKLIFLLFGIGFEHRSTLSQSIQCKTWQTHLQACQISGPNVLRPKQRHFEELSKQQRQLMRAIFRLRRKAVTAPLYFICGWRPPEFDVLMSQFIEIHSFCRNPLRTMLDLMREIYVKMPVNSSTWLNHMQQQADIFEVKGPGELLFQPPTADQNQTFKGDLKVKLQAVFEDRLRKEVAAMDSVEHFHPVLTPLDGRQDPVLWDIRNEWDVRAVNSAVKAMIGEFPTMEYFFRIQAIVSSRWGRERRQR